MRRFVTSLSLFMIFLIVLLTVCTLTGSARFTAFLINREAGLAVSRGSSGIEEAKANIEKSLVNISETISKETFEELTKLIYDNETAISEEDANEIFKKRFFINVKHRFGNGDGKLVQTLENDMPELKYGKLSVDKNNIPSFIRRDNIVILKNIPIQYTYKTIYEKKESFDVEIKIPDIILYDGSDEIFSYALIAGKGIYITGNTSTIMGNIFAGKHGPEEMRKSEALYAERELYGGLNIMSTQVAIQGTKIISEADINLRGSFVIMGSEGEHLDIYTNSINQVDNVTAKNILYHTGNTYKIENPSPEREMFNIASETFGETEFYYDSANDRFYNGTYRKIISAGDVTLKNDLTGIVIAPGSVIIEEGVNVEGLIICGDRIYIQGNNNIVSSKEVLRKIIKEELSDNMYVKVDVDDEMSEMSNLHMNVVDYLGNINFRGYFYN